MEVTVRIALILILKCLLGTRDIFLELKTNRGGCGQKMLNFPHCVTSTLQIFLRNEYLFPKNYPHLLFLFLFLAMKMRRMKQTFAINFKGGCWEKFIFHLRVAHE